MNRRSLLALGLATLLAGCGSFRLPQPSAWAGWGQQQDISQYAITAQLLRSGAKLQGWYQVAGLVVSTHDRTLDLTVDGETVYGTISGLNSIDILNDCTYDVTGTATDTELNLNLAPRGCTVGLSGTWTLNKCTTGTLDTLCGNIRQTAALEDPTLH